MGIDNRELCRRCQLASKMSGFLGIERSAELREVHLPLVPRQPSRTAAPAWAAAAPDLAHMPLHLVVAALIARLPDSRPFARRVDDRTHARVGGPPRLRGGGVGRSQPAGRSGPRGHRGHPARRWPGLRTRAPAHGRGEVGAELDDAATLLGRKPRRHELEPLTWALGLVSLANSAREYADSLRVLERTAGGRRPLLHRLRHPGHSHRRHAATEDRRSASSPDRTPSVAHPGPGGVRSSGQGGAADRPGRRERLRIHPMDTLSSTSAVSRRCRFPSTGTETVCPSVCILSHGSETRPPCCVSRDSWSARGPGSTACLRPL